jgi:hypothetical protein
MSIDVFPATVLNSTLWNGQTYEEGTFTVTATGFSGTAPSGTARYVRVGKQVTVEIPLLQGTSNATTFTLTGWPVALRPGAENHFVVRRGGPSDAQATLMLFGPTTTNPDVRFDMGGGLWATTGAKELSRVCITYLLA